MRLKKCRKILSLVTALIVGSLPVAETLVVSANTAVDHLIINQVYGTGGNTDTPIADSFIESVYTPVVASDTKVQGYNNVHSTLDMELIARHNSGAMNKDGGSLEIVEYNSTNGYAYAVSGLKGKIIAVNVSGVQNGEKVAKLDGVEYDVKEMVSGNKAFAYGDITSVAISPDGTKLAAAVQHEDYDKKGMVAIFDCQTDGSLKNPTFVEVGVQPDMVVFADANTILTADEGEPRNGYGEGTTDPEGTVSIINIAEQMSSEQVGFGTFKANDLTSENIILGATSSAVTSVIEPKYDLEPEYIAVSSDGKTAYVALQEANAIAVLDVVNKTFTGIYSVGFEDYSTVPVDLVEDDGYHAATYGAIVGARMPDGIAVYENGEKTYVVTANEGDSREWTDYKNEAKVEINAEGKNVTVLDQTLCAGLPEGKNVMFGGRGFSVFEVTADGLTEVYDSGSDFESITNEHLSQYFNCSNDKTKVDGRSAKKGPEPENVTVGSVNGKTYAFVAVERIGGIMVYDITDPAKATYTNYINSREFDDVIKGDVSPEGLCFIAGSESKSALLLTACEVSGTMPVYELKSNVTTEQNPDNTQTAAPSEVPTATPDNTQTAAPSEVPTATPDNVQTPAPTTSPDNTQAPDDDKPNHEAASKGTVIKADNSKGKYVVTSSNSGKLTVEYKSNTDKKQKSITVPNTVKADGITYKVTSIADKAFSNNKTVTKITVGKNVTEIGKQAFKGCTKLTTVTLSSNVKKIGSNAFEGCTSIKKITLPSKVNSLGSNIFKNCKNLKTITIKSTKLTVKNISKNAFNGVSAKVTIKVPKSKLALYKKNFKAKGLSKKVTVKGY